MYPAEGSWHGYRVSRAVRKAMQCDHDVPAYSLVQATTVVFAPMST